MQFWVDVVAEWRTETGKRALIALSAPKDVQDAILADPQRSPQIDAIDLKYWWVSGNKVFAPQGGQNLAPRQHEREAKIRRPEDTDLARMAAEYRAKYPNKAVLCDNDKAGWAFVCAGGSVPNLPRTTDARLLIAIPRMKPWQAATTDQQWTLRERGRNYLIHSASGAEVKLDLSGESGTFTVNVVNPDTGAVTPRSERVTASRSVVLRKPSDGRATFWLTRESTTHD
jgi:hypothetical protein